VARYDEEFKLEAQAAFPGMDEEQMMALKNLIHLCLEERETGGEDDEYAGEGEDMGGESPKGGPPALALVFGEAAKKKR